jgi:integrase
MSTLRFVLRTDHPDKNGLSPIEGLYQISIKTSVARKYFRIDKKFRLFKENWDAKAQRAIFLDKKEAKKLLPDVPYDLFPTSQEVDDINTTLANVERTIGKIEQNFEFKNVPYDTGMVVQAYKDLRPQTEKKEAPKPRSNELFDFIDKYIIDHKDKRKAGSLTVYRTLKSHLKNFEIAKKFKVTFENINYDFFTQFENYLLSLKKPNGEPRLYSTTIGKQLSTIKTFLNYARLNDYKIDDTKYKLFKIKKQKKKVIALTFEEFERLYKMNLSFDKRLDKVRDCFIFSCATGLRYSDMKQLTWEHIKGDSIVLAAIVKTGDPLTIPLNPYSAAILQKYKGLHKPLPVISNQKMNAYLKGYTDKRTLKHVEGLCELAKIDERIEIVRKRGDKDDKKTYPKYQLIGVHTGRKTFCTLSLEFGMSAEETMAISGHLDYQSFKKYIDITEERKKKAMKDAWGAAKLPKLKSA